MKIKWTFLVLLVVWGNVLCSVFADTFDLRGDLLIRYPLTESSSNQKDKGLENIQIHIHMSVENSNVLPEYGNPVFQRRAVPVSKRLTWVNQAELPPGITVQVNFEAQSLPRSTGISPIVNFVHYPDVPRRVIGQKSKNNGERIIITLMHPKRAMQIEREKAKRKQRKVVDNSNSNSSIKPSATNEQILEILSHYDKAIQYLQYGDTYFQMGNFLDITKNLTDAAEAYEKAAQIYSDEIDKKRSWSRKLRCLGDYVTEEALTNEERIKRSQIILEEIQNQKYVEVDTFNGAKQRYWIDALNIVSGAKSKWNIFGLIVEDDEDLLKSWSRLYYTSYKKVKIPEVITHIEIQKGAIDLENYLQNSK